MNIKFFSVLFAVLFLSGAIVACSGAQTSVAPVLTPPAISVEITGDNCPSVEVQAGMQVVWTNRDDIDRTLMFERNEENGALIDSGGIDLLQPGSTFSTTFVEPGQYTYYCSEDQTAFGTITVLP
jgi:plastocyanin